MTQLGLLQIRNQFVTLDFYNEFSLLFFVDNFKDFIRNALLGIKDFNDRFILMAKDHWYFWDRKRFSSN